jgi:flavin reductase (DIM6/NTAB) family NADH-FMN oxidoreductase RutF
VLEEGGCFAVNILGEHQETVSRIFAKKAEPESGSLRGEKFRIGTTGAPILEDCLAWLDCRVVEKLDGGDHTIFLGEVVDEGVSERMRPLLFYRGGYHALAG